MHNRPEVVRDVEALGATGLQELRAVVVEVVPVDCDVGVSVLALLLVPEAQGVGDLMHGPSCHLRIVTIVTRDLKQVEHSEMTRHATKNPSHCKTSPESRETSDPRVD